jgi:FMN phosphatase YigB (HAD superfamily)
VNYEHDEMKESDKHKVFIGAYRTMRDEGFWVLANRLIPSWLPAARCYLISDFSNMPKILAWLETHNLYDVYSFDIFDTLLRRRIDPPELIKALAAEYLSTRLAQYEINIRKVEILAQRKECEESLLQEALSRGRDADYCLDDVITETLKAIKAERALGSEQIVSYEMELEKKAAQPMPGAVEVLSYLKSMGKRVICTSDSYLSAEQMAEILESQGLMRCVDKLYVSSDIGKRKSTGRLFQHVLEQEGRNLVHIGDNYSSDRVIPRKLGITALWFHSGSEQRRKNELRKLLRGKNKMDYVNAIVRSSDQHKSELQRVGYEVLGPALTVFIHNVTEQARKDKVEVLFFVARDGYALKKIYEALQGTIYAESGLPLGKYLCLGRLPVRLASLHELSHADVLKVYGYIARFPGRSVSLGDIMGSYGLEPDGFIDIARRYGLDLNEPIVNPAQDERLHKLLGSDDFQRMVREKSGAARGLLRDYLAGIGFMGKKKVAVVDANAEGLTQSILDMIFADDTGYPAVSRYYFNLVTLDIEKAGINVDLSKVIGVVSDWRRDSKNEQGPFQLLGMFIELFSHPNHGVAVGYKRVGGRIVPVFRKTPQESEYPLTSQGLQGILSYARDYGTYHGLHNYRCDQLLDYVKDNIRQWIWYPPKRDVEAVRDLFLTSDWPIEINHRLIEPIKGWDMVTIRSLRRKVASSWWPEATLRLAPASGLSLILYRAMATLRHKIL